MVLKNKSLLLCMLFIIANTHGSDKQPTPRASLWKTVFYGLLLASSSVTAQATSPVVACADICHEEGSWREDWTASWYNFAPDCVHVCHSTKDLGVNINQNWAYKNNAWTFKGDRSLLIEWSPLGRYQMAEYNMGTKSFFDCRKKITEYNSSRHAPYWAYKIFEKSPEMNKEAYIKNLCITPKNPCD